jgi:hypothetical protein
MTRPLPIRPYSGAYGPLHAYFADHTGCSCVITEAVNHDLRPRLFLGLYGHLMCLSPDDARRLVQPLHHYAQTGRLPHPTASTSGDYEI